MIGKFAAGAVAVGITAAMFACLAWGEPDDPVELFARAEMAMIVLVAKDPAESMPIENLMSAWNQVWRKSSCDTDSEKRKLVCTEKARFDLEFARRGYCFAPSWDIMAKQWWMPCSEIPRRPQARR